MCVARHKLQHLFARTLARSTHNAQAWPKSRIVVAVALCRSRAASFIVIGNDDDGDDALKHPAASEKRACAIVCL